MWKWIFVLLKQKKKCEYYVRCFQQQISVKTGNYRRRTEELGSLFRSKRVQVLIMGYGPWWEQSLTRPEDTNPRRSSRLMWKDLWTGSLSKSLVLLQNWPDLQNEAKLKTEGFQAKSKTSHFCLYQGFFSKHCDWRRTYINWDKHLSFQKHQNFITTVMNMAVNSSRPFFL